MSQSPDGNTRTSSQTKPKRCRIPKLNFTPERGYHVAFTNAEGRFQRHTYDVPKKKTKENDAKAQRLHRLWVAMNIPGATELPEFADLNLPVNLPVRPDGTVAPATAENPTTMPNLITAFLEMLQGKIKRENGQAPPEPSGDAAPSSDEGTSRRRRRRRAPTRFGDRQRGSMSLKEFWHYRTRVLNIGHWCKAHFGERFKTTPFAELIYAKDYNQMMGHYNNEYSGTYPKKMRLAFWRFARFAALPPYSQRLSFDQDAVDEYTTSSKAAIPEFPTLPHLKRCLAVASLEKRLWIWLALGCGFGPKDLAVLQPLDFDKEDYDLTRTKTHLPRSGKTPPMVWAHLEAFLKDNPRGDRELLFVTRNGRPIVDTAEKTAEELKFGTLTHGAKDTPYKENNALADAWDVIRERAGVTKDEVLGFYMLRHVATTVFTTRPEARDMHVLWRWLGHAPGNTYQVYTHLITPRTKALVSWVREMLDKPGIDDWRDQDVRKYEELESQREAAAKERMKRRRKSEVAGETTQKGRQRLGRCT